MAIRKLPKLNPFTVLNPTKVLIQPPTTAPAIPNRIVIIIPPPSFPGINHFATIPVINPKKIHNNRSIITISYNFIFTSTLEI